MTLGPASRRGGRPRTTIALVLATLLFGTSVELGSAVAAPDVPHEPAVPVARDGFALVLGGGGARGFAHVGVMMALEQLGLRPSFIAGTSMGAIVGAMYAAGHTAGAIDSLLHDRNWLLTVLDEPPPPIEVQGGWRASLPVHQFRFQLDRWPISLPAGVSHGQSVEALIGRMTADALFLADRDFDRLPIPFRCVATDVVTGEAVIPSAGVLARMVRASGSMPLVFAPVEHEGRLLLDGGLVDNLPLRVARAQGYARALVVDVSNTFLPLTEIPDDFFAIATRATQLAQREQNMVDPGPEDVVLRVDLRRFSVLSFTSARKIVRAGYDAAMAHAEELRALGTAVSGPPGGPARLGPVEVAEVTVHGNRRLSDWSVRKRFDLRPTDRIELEELWLRAESLASQSVFEHAWVDVVPLGDGRARVELHVKERDRPELEVAANHREGEGAALLLRLRLDNRLGAGSARTLSWRLGKTLSELQANTSTPIRGSRRVEVRASGGMRNESVEIFDQGEELDTWSLRSVLGSADLVLALADLDLGLHLGVAAQSTRRRLGSGGEVGRAQWRALHAGLETWTGGGLNPWPTDGMALHAHWGLEALGGQLSAWQIEGGLVRRVALTGRWGMSLVTGGAWSSEDLPVELQARAGGPRSWVGLRPDEILAPRLAWGRLGFDLYLTREWRIEAAVASGWYGEASLDEHRPRPGAQLQTVWDSAVGPVHLGWSASRRGESQVFVDFGYEF